VQSIGRSMDWTLKDNMVDGLFCATLTGCRGVHIPFVQAGAEMSDTGTEADKPDASCSWEGHSGCVCTGVWNENAESGVTDGEARGRTALPGKLNVKTGLPLADILIQYLFEVRATLHSLVHVTRVHTYLPAAQHVLANLTYYLKKLLISVLNQVLSAVKNKESAFKSGSLPSNILSQ